MFLGWLHEAFGTYDKAFYIAGSVAIFSSLLIFGVNYMIRKQFTEREIEEQLGLKSDTSLSVSEAETASDSAYKDTESKPMLEEEEYVAVNKFCKLHCALRTSKALLVVDRETVL